MTSILSRAGRRFAVNGSRALSLSSRSQSLLVTPKEVSAWEPESYVPVDASWFMPNSPRKAFAEYMQKRIPNARFFDVDKVATIHELGLPHMLPDGETFASALEFLAIEPKSKVVIYDTQGVFSSPRALFTFKAFGHENALVLNGGLPRWEAEKLPLETEAPKALQKSTYRPTPEPQGNVIRSYAQMVSNSQCSRDDKATELVLDARSQGRFTGKDAEPRPGLPAGHIPGALSMPFNNLLETHSEVSPSYTTMLPAEKLRAVFQAALGPYAEDALAGRRPIVNSCGSGMTACIVWLALQEVGVHSALYDESWTGWALRPESAVAKGED